MSIFFFNDTATTEIYTLSLHDALPIFSICFNNPQPLSLLRFFITLYKTKRAGMKMRPRVHAKFNEDRKSTRLNSSHANISYAVFCLQKKNAAVPASNALPTVDEFVPSY